MQTEEQVHNHSSSEDLRQQVTEGLLYGFRRINANSSKTLEASAFLFALIELLSDKGLISIEEIDKRKKEVGKRLVKKFTEQGNGVVFQEPEYDKYTFESSVEIDCENRIHLCKAACCRLPFPLSKQDVHEGIVRWEFGKPYLIARDKDGYCSHMDRGTCACTIYKQRPVPCRAYDCRKDKRIWEDFEKKVINREIYQDDWPQCLAQKNKTEESIV